MAEIAAVGPRGPYRNGIKRREQIVRSAAKVFAEMGYSGGSIRTIAARVGVSPATLIQHFGNKEGLLEAVLEAWTRETDAIYGRHLEGLAWIESTRGWIDYHLHHRGLIELFLTMAAEASSPTHPARAFIQHRYADTFHHFTHHLRVACRLGEVAPLTDIEIETEARVLIAVLDGLELQWLIDPAMDLASRYDEHLTRTIRRWQGDPSEATR